MFIEGRCRVRPVFPQVAGLEGTGIVTAVGADARIPVQTRVAFRHPPHGRRSLSSRRIACTSSLMESRRERGAVLSAIGPDFLTTVEYKWLLGPYGLGYLYVAPRWRDGGIPGEQRIEPTKLVQDHLALGRRVLVECLHSVEDVFQVERNESHH